MKTSYAVKWREPEGHTFLGRLEFGPKALLLEGRSGSESAIRRTLNFGEMRGFRLAHSASERLDGRPTLVVERPRGDFLVTTTVMHAGLLQELVHRLSELSHERPSSAPSTPVS